MIERACVGPYKEDWQADSPASRHARGAFFTPEPIAAFLADWAISENPHARVLDPTSGDGIFLLAAARTLRSLGCETDRLPRHVFGVDLHATSLESSMVTLESHGLDARLFASDLFDIESMPSAGMLPAMDAVVGNPPFVRYQNLKEAGRRKALAAALTQGVRLTRMTSSWAPTLVHAASFLKPEGRLAMVLPAELLTVQYAQPIRTWLKNRFALVTLIVFEQLQFTGALEKTVLLLAEGSGGCASFSLAYAKDHSDLDSLAAIAPESVWPRSDHKWTDLLLRDREREMFQQALARGFTSLRTYGSPYLGTVTGANHYFALSEKTRRRFAIDETDLVRLCPPGTRHLPGLSFTHTDWLRLRDEGERVWLFRPAESIQTSATVKYIRLGKLLGVDKAYKCQVRNPWWSPPSVRTPDLFFTYMSHRYPRLISNSAGVAFVNSMHGLRVEQPLRQFACAALPLIMMNSVTMLGAELYGRSYGGGVLKMEPREAAALPLPAPEALQRSWAKLRSDKTRLDRKMREGSWMDVLKRVDDVLLRDVLRFDQDEIVLLRDAAAHLRARRLAQ